MLSYTGIESLLFCLLLILSLDTIQVIYAQEATVEGRFVSPDNNLEIIFPEGWSGNFVRSPDNSTSVVVSPGQAGVNETSVTTTVSIFVNTVTRQIANQTNLFKNIDESTCKEKTIEEVMVNEMQATSVSMTECDGFPFYKAKVYFFQTEQDVIALGYVAPSDSEFDKYQSEFESSANDLRIANTIRAPAIPEFPYVFIVAILALGLMMTLRSFVKGSLWPD